MELEKRVLSGRQEDLGSRWPRRVRDSLGDLGQVASSVLAQLLIVKIHLVLMLLVSNKVWVEGAT